MILAGSRPSECFSQLTPGTSFSVVGNVPELRVTVMRDVPANDQGHYVLYWMTAFRRARWNFALQRAVEWSVRLKKPLLVLEPLRCGYRWASDRFHRFILEGMADNARDLQRRGVDYYPYIEPRPGAGSGLLAAMASRACVVVGDDYPCFFLPRMIDAAHRHVTVRWEQVDSNGLLPVKAAPNVFRRAFDFRRFLQRSLAPHLEQLPSHDPLPKVRLPAAAALPDEWLKQWPRAAVGDMLRSAQSLAALPIDHRVTPVDVAGGSTAGANVLRQFLDHKIRDYEEARNQPERDVASGLSPYLHFGHIASHEVFWELMKREGWTPARLSGQAKGNSAGWWGVGSSSEAFLDQLVTWRELGYNLCSKTRDYDQYESLPDWARRTLEEHAADRREQLYSEEQFATAETHDPLWNAAQRQLVREGRIHNYLRMLWGKKILQWTAHPRDALEIMIELNNRYALDGRDPNSYSGIFWCLGRYDRPWAPQRPVFGCVRYMSSENTARKVRVREYLAQYGRA
jgi:deoxyribodipyrimidine photo-lyase